MTTMSKYRCGRAEALNRRTAQSELQSLRRCSPGAVPAFAQSTAEKLDALDARITRLEDLNQIERLQRTYGYFVDKSQWKQLSELFTDDATLEIGGKGIFTGKPRVLEYMQTAFGPDGAKEGSLANHMQFQSIPDISADGKRGWIRSRAYVMSIGGWGLPLYENEYRKRTACGRSAVSPAPSPCTPTGTVGRRTRSTTPGPTSSIRRRICRRRPCISLTRRTTSSRSTIPTR